MAISAKEVAALRERTGCGMMDCKRALVEADGDMEAAVDILREKGLAAAVKKAGRIAAEGVAFAEVAPDGKAGVLIEVNSETDFVSKNAEFQAFVKTCADTVLEQNPADVDALLQCTAAGAGVTVDALLKEKIQTIGENIKIRRFARFEGDCVAYVHGGGRIGVLVKMEADGAASGSEAMIECGKDVAMQIAALNPLYLDKTVVPEADLAKEKEVLLAQIDLDPKNASKPQNIKEKMILGRINKFYEQNCLMQQAFVKDGDITVEKYVASMAQKAGGAMKVADFARFEKGEGLQKREDNFADEVASMVK